MIVRPGFILLMALLLSVLGACTYQHTTSKVKEGLQALKITESYPVVRQKPWLISRDAPVYVVYPQQDISVVQSKELFNALCAAVSNYFPLYRAGVKPETLRDAIYSAQQHQIPFLLYPKIITKPVTGVMSLKRWTIERNKPQDFWVQVLLFDAVNETLIDIGMVEGYGADSLLGLAAPTPEKLYASLLEYVKGLGVQ